MLSIRSPLTQSTFRNSTVQQVNSKTAPSAQKNFWESINGVADETPNNLGAIVMTGELTKKMSFDINPKGIAHVEAKRVKDKFVLSLCDSENWHRPEVQQVYWLPWSSGEDFLLHPGHQVGAEFVTLEDLDASGCQYFMTSNLSGCRFVQTDKYVAHISRAQMRAHDDVVTDSVGRNIAEKRIHNKFHPTRRAVLSQSFDSIPFDLTTENSSHSYQRDGKEGVGSAFVIGIKQDDGSWTFKYLKHDLGEDHAAGTWHVMADEQEVCSEADDDDADATAPNPITV